MPSRHSFDANFTFLYANFHFFDANFTFLYANFDFFDANFTFLYANFDFLYAKNDLFMTKSHQIYRKTANNPSMIDPFSAI